MSQDAFVMYVYMFECPDNCCRHRRSSPAMTRRSVVKGTKQGKAVQRCVFPLIDPAAVVWTNSLWTHCTLSFNTACGDNRPHSGARSLRSGGNALRSGGSSQVRHRSPQWEYVPTPEERFHRFHTCCVQLPS